jgi:DNA-directed RNA polymerase subunit RPC12/RpoP
MGTLRVPVPVVAIADAQPAAVAAPAPNVPPPTPPPFSGGAPLVRPSGRKYGFPCVYCSSRLEASESQGGTDGHCPTCGQPITIPILDRFGRLIDPRTNQVIKPDPHPVHAYAAAGTSAPRIIRRHDGSQEIVCPRCHSGSPINVNNCRNCGAPFTLEGTAPDLHLEGNGYATASLVLGIISIPASCLAVPGPLAVILGSISLYQRKDDTGGKGIAYAGVICGAVGTLITLYIYVFR